jgi:alpha-D-ribose 1-methylphosphonate 5-triphosphate synthase subunit PhnH
MQNKIHTNAIFSQKVSKNQFMIVQTLKTIFNLNRLKQEIELYPNESQIWKIQKE